MSNRLAVPLERIILQDFIKLISKFTGLTWTSHRAPLSQFPGNYMESWIEFPVNSALEIAAAFGTDVLGWIWKHRVNRRWQWILVWPSHSGQIKTSNPTQIDSFRREEFPKPPPGADDNINAWDTFKKGPDETNQRESPCNQRRNTETRHSVHRQWIPTSTNGIPAEQLKRKTKLDWIKHATEHHLRIGDRTKRDRGREEGGGRGQEISKQSVRLLLDVCH